MCIAQGAFPPLVRIPNMILPLARAHHHWSLAECAKRGQPHRPPTQLIPHFRQGPSLYMGGAQVQSLTPTPPKHFSPLKGRGGEGA